MNLFDRITSLVTLASFFTLAPAFSRRLLASSGGARPIAQSFCTLIAIALLATGYGALWKVHPKSVSWYGWIQREIPFAGDATVQGTVAVEGPVDVTGNVTVDGEVEIKNEPLKVEVER